MELHLQAFLPFFPKGNNFCDSLTVSLDDKAPFEMGQLFQEKIFPMAGSNWFL